MFPIQGDFNIEGTQVLGNQVEEISEGVAYQEVVLLEEMAVHFVAHLRDLLGEVAQL